MPIGSEAGGVGRESGKTCGELISAGLRRMGRTTTAGDDRAVMREALTSAIHTFNLMRNWVDRRLVATITLAASTATYALPARYRLPIGRAWLNDTDGNRSLALRFYTFEEFLEEQTDEDVGESTPKGVYVTNRVSTGLLTVWPTPSSGSVAVYPSIELVYYAEIPTCSDDNDDLGVSGALEEAILSEAVSIANDMLGDPDHGIRFFSRADRLKRDAIGYDQALRLNKTNLRGPF